MNKPKDIQEDKFSFAWFARFFMPVTNLDVEPPITKYADTTDAKKCWEYFVEPLIHQTQIETEKRIVEEVINLIAYRGHEDTFDDIEKKIRQHFKEK